MAPMQWEDEYEMWGSNDLGGGWSWHLKKQFASRDCRGNQEKFPSRFPMTTPKRVRVLIFQKSLIRFLSQLSGLSKVRTTVMNRLIRRVPETRQTSLDAAFMRII